MNTPDGAAPTQHQAVAAFDASARHFVDTVIALTFPKPLVKVEELKGDCVRLTLKVVERMTQLQFSEEADYIAALEKMRAIFEAATLGLDEAFAKWLPTRESWKDRLVNYSLLALMRCYIDISEQFICILPLGPDLLQVT